MNKIYKLLALVFSFFLMLMYQNCGDLGTESITSLSKSIIGESSINGEIFILNQTEVNDYLAAELQNSGFNGTIPTNINQISALEPNESLSTNDSSNYLCMVASVDNASEYFPLGFDDYENFTGTLVPICMASSSCVSSVAEIGSVRPMLSSLCQQSNTLVKKFNSGQVLQLVKRY